MAEAAGAAVEESAIGEFKVSLQGPLLRPGESFKYSSWCPLKTPMGMMHGTYQMARSDGSRFEIEIAPFALRAPQTVH